MATAIPPGSVVSVLSGRERDIVRCIALGYTNRETAELLYLSETTVKTYKARAQRKLGMRTRPELTAWALRARLIP